MFQIQKYADMCSFNENNQVNFMDLVFTPFQKIDIRGGGVFTNENEQ